MNQVNNSSSPVLLVDDEPHTLLSFSVLLRSEGITNVLTSEDSRQALNLLSKHDVSVVVLDLLMPHKSGSELLNEIHSDYPQVPVIVVTAINELETAIECMKAGAFDYLAKPVEKSRLVSAVKRALELRALRNEVDSLKQHLLSDQLKNASAFSLIITCSKKMLAIFKYVEVISRSDQPVLITGETGVGKELIAKSIHKLSRCKGKLVSVNVAGLDDTMFSDTLFGHTKGAYTGAELARKGLITQASKGTLFLDEIGNLTEASQIKLLRLLQEHEYYSLGSDIPQKSDARIIVATNQDLQKSITTGKFRKDLYYRLRAHQIHVPPLHERIEDIPLLTNHFLVEAAKSLGKKKPTPPPELFKLLSTHHFQGNVRELQAMVFDAVTRHKSGVLSMESFKEVIGQEQSSEKTDFALTSQASNVILNISGRFPTLKETENYLISEALKLSGGNQGIAASLLGITRQALNKRLNRKTKSSSPQS